MGEINLLVASWKQEPFGVKVLGNLEKKFILFSLLALEVL